VSQALEVSCNYFFAAAAYRMGNAQDGNRLGGIDAMDQTMRYFGLDAKTGVEISEVQPTLPSPDYKQAQILTFNPDAATYDLEWHDGDTIQAAIGQGFVNMTAANMDKYITTLATHGIRYQLHLVDSVRSAGGAIAEKTTPNIEAQNLPISESTWDAVYEGMKLVTEGPSGTARNIFKDFPIEVAGKTGTAEVNNHSDSTSFGGFAPFDDPQIAVYVSVPYGSTNAMPNLAAQVAKQVMSAYFGLDDSVQNTTSDNTLVE
jgi:penicillin-binding protein 2